MLTQYSPRLVETMVADTEVTLTTQPDHAASARFCSSIHRATAWVRKYGPLQVDAEQPLEALLPRLQEVARARGATPALLTRTWSRPKRSRTSERSRARSLRSPTSART